MNFDNPYARRVQTVSEFTLSLKGLIETSYSAVTLSGEISNLRAAGSGHIYFTLKDTQAQLRAVLFRGQQRYMRCQPKDGMKVLCQGRVSLYEPRGEYQLVVNYLDDQGQGLLQLAFMQLKEKLAAEGLFKDERKRPLPFLPRRIALVSSAQGAAVVDFLKVAARRCPYTAIEIFPARMQGKGAAEEIAAAIESLNQRALSEVIVLCRGGGSLEDLWAFNEEPLARAIAASAIPVVSAVGHEVDFTISDLVADLRASTPTAAAEIILPDQQVLLDQLAESQGKIIRAINNIIGQAKDRLNAEKRLLGDPARLLAHQSIRLDHLKSELAYRLKTKTYRFRERLNLLGNNLQSLSPERRVQQKRARLSEEEQRLCFFINRRLAESRGRLSQQSAILDSLSPLSVLGRGYCLAYKQDGAIVRSVKQTSVGELLEVKLAEGEISCLRER